MRPAASYRERTSDSGLGFLTAIRLRLRSGSGLVSALLFYDRILAIRRSLCRRDHIASYSAEIDVFSPEVTFTVSRALAVLPSSFDFCDLE